MQSHKKLKVEELSGLPVVKKQVRLNFEEIHAGFPPSGEDLRLVFDWLLSKSFMGAPLMPGTYHCSEQFELILECVLVMRRDDYGVTKIDLVSEQSAIGRGGLGWVAPVITLMKDRDGSAVICKDKTNKRVGKVMVQAISTTDKSVEVVARELKNAGNFVKRVADMEVTALKALKQLNVRGPYHSKHSQADIRFYGMLTMEKISGIDLFDRIGQNVNFSIREILEIQLQGLSKLKSQFHDREMLHNDIKPENIKLSRIKNKLRLRLFDCSFSRNLYDGRDMGKCGSVKYMAPEVILENKYSSASDLYSLGLCLRLLMGDETFLHFMSIQDEKQYIEARASHHWYIAAGFKNRSDISEELYAELKDIVLAMTHPDCTKRPDLSECIERTEDVLGRYLLVGIQYDCEKEKVSSALQNAWFFAEKTRKYGLQCTQGYERLAYFKSRLHKKLEPLKSTPDQVKLFCDMQEENCLQDIYTFEALEALIDRIINQYESVCRKWDALAGVLMNAQDNKSLMQEYEAFTRKIWSAPQQLDVMVQETQHIQRKIKKMEGKLTPVHNFSC